MPDETISFYFNALFISGWALVSAHPEMSFFYKIPTTVIKRDMSLL